MMRANYLPLTRHLAYTTVSRAGALQMFACQVRR